MSETKKYIILILLVCFSTCLVAQNALDVQTFTFYRTPMKRTNRSALQLSDKSVLLPSVGYTLSYLFDLDLIRLKVGYQRTHFWTREEFNTMARSGLEGSYKAKNKAAHLLIQAGIKGSNKWKGINLFFGYRQSIDEEMISIAPDNNARREVNMDSTHYTTYHTAHCSSVSIGVEFVKRLNKRFEMYSSLETEYRFKPSSNASIFEFRKYPIYQAHHYNKYYFNVALGARYYLGEPK